MYYFTSYEIRYNNNKISCLNVGKPCFSGLFDNILINCSEVSLYLPKSDVDSYTYTLPEEILIKFINYLSAGGFPIKKGEDKELEYNIPSSKKKSSFYNIIITP